MLFLFVLAHFAHHMVNGLPAPLMPLIREEFSLDYTQVGLVLSALNLTYGFSNLPAGWLSDRLGARILLTVGVGGVALAGLGIGFSQTYVMLIAFLMLMGILGGSYHPSAPSLISAAVEPKNRGRAFGFHMIGGSSGYFLTPLAAAAISAIWGWRAPFIVIAIPVFIYAIVFYILLKHIVKPRDTATVKVGSTSPITTPQDKNHLVPFLILSCSMQAIVGALIAFVPLFVVDRFGMAKEAAGAFMSFIYSSGLWAGPLGGHLSDRLGTVRVLVVSCLLSGPILYLLTLMPAEFGVGAVLIFLGAVWYAIQPTSEAYVVSHTTEKRRSTVLGLMYFSSIEGTALFNVVMGILIEKLGFSFSISISAATLVVLAAIFGFILRGSRS